MKKIIITYVIFCIVSLFGNIQAQNNLEFNKVIFHKLSGSGFTGGPLDSYTIVVDTLKVVKIESMGASGNNKSLPWEKCYMTLDGVTIGAEANGMEISFPLWLPQGSYVVDIRTTQQSSLYWHVKGYVSGIEFNLVQ